MTDDEQETFWYHRGPCCRPCSICGGTGHYVWNPDDQPEEEWFELHICANGCDGFPVCIP